MMLVRFQVAGSLPLPTPPEPWVERAMGLAAKPAAGTNIRRALAKLVFDSWSLPEPVGVRGGAAIEQRRIRFESDQIAIDLRAEHQSTGWSFVAQITGIKADRARVHADGRILTLDNYGICQWSYRKPPKQLVVVTETSSVELPELTWKMKPSKR
jgi:hypothetical protein